MTPGNEVVIRFSVQPANETKYAESLMEQGERTLINF